MTKPILICITGPTCAGKDEIISRIKEKFGEDKDVVFKEIWYFRSGVEGNIGERIKKRKNPTEDEMDVDLFMQRPKRSSSRQRHSRTYSQKKIR